MAWHAGIPLVAKGAGFMTYARRLALGAACLAVAACGPSGEGSEEGQPVVVQPPPIGGTPPPPPPPPPPPVAAAFPPSNLSASQSFSVLGYSYDYPGCPMGCPGPIVAGPSTDDSLALRYNAANSSFEVELPGFQPGRLVLGASQTGLAYNVTQGLSSTERQQATLYFHSGIVDQGLKLQHSNYVEWHGYAGAARSGYFAFGIPAAASAVPAGGTRQYRGVSGGLTDWFAIGDYDYDYYAVAGTGSLQFDFAARTISGSLGLSIDDFGREGPFNVLQLSGSIDQGTGGTFRGTVSAPGVAEKGTFEGRFAGPDASEIILRWRSPAIDPRTKRPLLTFGAFAGRAAGAT